MSENLALATAYVNTGGYSLCPVRTDGSKAAAVKWEPYQIRKPTTEELKQWFGNGHRHGIALIHGAVSGNAEAVDVETAEAFSELAALCADHGLAELLERMPLIETPKGGRHLLYRCVEPVDGNTKLARFADGTVKIETRGEHGYTLAPGSPPECHPSGREYQFLRRCSVPTITAEERAALLAMARATNEYAEPERTYQPRETPKERRDAALGGLRPGDDFNARGDVLPLLLSRGWQIAGQRGETLDLTRPGKSVREGISATVGHCGAGVFYCFTSSAPPFEMEHAYPPFSVYALLECGGDFAEAARQLATQGYGDQTPPEVRRAQRHNDAPPTDGNAPASGTPRVPDAQEIPAARFQGEYAPYQVAALLGFDTGVAADTHKAHAERIQQQRGQDLAYCKGLGGWLLYNGKCWLCDGREREAPTLITWAAALSSVVREEAALLYTMAASLARDGRNEDSEALAKAARKHLKHADKIENTQFLRDSLTQAAGKSGADPTRFEPRPWVIGFDNGVWDRGQWREHRREDGFLAVSPVDYDPGADRSEWHALLSRMTDGDNDLALTLQDVCGYVLSGASTLRTIPWSYGPRGCGKSTLAELLLTLLGSMGHSVDPAKLADEASRERLGADIFGTRLVTISEAGNKRISIEVLKTMSGSDSFPVRHLFAETFTARPSHVLLLMSNDPPRLDSSYDEALRERVLILPLTHELAKPGPLEFSDGARVEEVRRNPKSALLRGFAAWAVDGLDRVWHAQEIHRAACIDDANRQFWREVDPLGDFWEMLDRSALERGISKSDLRSQYDVWCAEKRIRRPYNLRDWVRACKARGLEERRATGGVRMWFLAEPSLFSQETPESDESDNSDVNPESPRERVDSNSIDRFGNNVTPVTPVTPLILVTDDLEGLTDPFGEDESEEEP